MTGLDWGLQIRHERDKQNLQVPEGYLNQILQ